jgi:hypothetical protein
VGQGCRAAGILIIFRLIRSKDWHQCRRQLLIIRLLPITTSLLATRGRCIATICPMSSSHACSLCSILFQCQHHRDEPISEQARIALPVCVAH